MSILDKLHFGETESERDVLLANSFIETETFTNVINKKKQIILGRKGSGKSAIYRILIDKGLKDTLIIPISFDEYNWVDHLAVKDLKLAPEDMYKKTWLKVIYTQIARAYITFLRGKYKCPRLKKRYRKFLKIYNMFYDDKIETSVGLLWKRLKVPKYIKASAGPAGLEVGLSEQQIKQLQAIDDFNTRMEEVINKFLNIDFKEIFVLFDKLDTGWNIIDDERNFLLVGLLRVIKDFSENIRVPFLNCVIFLRDDIYDSLHAEDLNKLSQILSIINWGKDALKKLIELRIKTSLKDNEISLNNVFTTDFIASKQEVIGYITSRSYLRPRDFIAYCNEALKIAKENKHQIITQRDILNAKKGYSKHIERELWDENQKIHPEFREYLKILSKIGKMTFTYDEFIITSREMGYTDDETKRILNLFYTLSIIGYLKSRGYTGGTKLIFKYLDYNSELDTSKPLKIHRSLLAALEVKET